MENRNDLLYSYYMMRKIIGLLGIFLPVLVVAFYGSFLSSFSHYYYTKSAVFYIAIHSAFGIFLISYRGYKRDKGIEKTGDNTITTIGGIAAFLVVLFPASCAGDFSNEISKLCASGVYPLFGHNNAIINLIHMISAGMFIFTMGWMSIFKFTKGELTKQKRKRNSVYRISGGIMWLSLIIILIEFFIDRYFTYYDVFILETISVFAFGISWLIKGETIKNIIYSKSKKPQL